MKGKLDYNIIRKIGFAVTAAHIFQLLASLLLLVFNPNGAGIILVLAVGIPFSLICLFASFIIGRVKVLPTLYFCVSAFILFFAYMYYTPDSLGAICTVLKILGTITCFATILCGIMSKFVSVYQSVSKSTITLGVCVFLLIVIITLIFIGFSITILSATNGNSALPVR